MAQTTRTSIRSTSTPTNAAALRMLLRVGPIAVQDSGDGYFPNRVPNTERMIWVEGSLLAAERDLPDALRAAAR